MTQLIGDFETRSVIDIKVCGLDRYVKHPSTQVLLFAWATGDGPVNLWECLKEPMPPELLKLLLDPNVQKLFWNASFECQVFKHVLKMEIPLEQVCDIMVLARHLSLPGHLADAGKAIGLPFDQAKNSDGKRLIQKFSMPFHKGGEETLFGISEPRFHDWEDEPRDWALFGEYCKQDVVAERAILRLVQNIPLPDSEQRAWILDQKINERGIPVNRKFVENALALALQSKKKLTDRLKLLTGLANPNSRPQFLPWAQAQGYPHLSLGKAFVKAALAQDSGITPLCREVLELRQEAAKTSYTKYENILEKLSDDNRLRHQFAFMGAARTGRWSGGGGGNKKGVQVHNLPRPGKEIEAHYARALEIIEAGVLSEAVENEVKSWFKPEPRFSPIIALVVSCLRSAFQAPTGKKLVVCDLGSIENRVLGWLADCDAILKVFRDGRDAYLDFAAKMYAVIYESLIKIVEGVHKAKDKDAGEKRQVAKPAVLGAGYGLGPGVKKNPDGTYEIIWIEDRYGNRVKTGLMGYAENMGVKLTPEQAYLAWETFRKAYPEVVELWRKYEKAALRVLETGQPVKVGKMIFQRRARKDGTFILRIVLPSGRGLHYMNARVELETAQKKNGETYERKKLMYAGVGHGVGQVGNKTGWSESVYTYGGKITENADQAFSRDVLLNGMFLADEAGAQIVMHVHDEIVCEEDADPFAFSLTDLKHCMETVPEWAPGLMVAAEGYEGRVYKK
jgi:DNA polymerase bacteriophage-type